MANDYIHLGLISAMPEEVGETVKNLDLVKTIKYGDLEIFIGFLKTNRRIRFNSYQASPSTGYVTNTLECIRANAEIIFNNLSRILRDW